MNCHIQTCPNYDPNSLFNCSRCLEQQVTDCETWKNEHDLDKAAPAPLYVKFSFADYWCHIPQTEVYPVWTEFDLAMSLMVFRERHGDHGDVVVFESADGVEWELFGKRSELTS